MSQDVHRQNRSTCASHARDKETEKEKEIQRKTLLWQTGYSLRPSVSSNRNRFFRGISFWRTVIDVRFH